MSKTEAMNNILENYHYEKITRKQDFNLIKTRYTPLSKLLTEDIEKQIYDINSETYMIISEDNIIGFFTLSETVFKDFQNNKYDALKLVCIYIYGEYRNKGVGSAVLYDIQWSMKHNMSIEYEYIIAYSFVDTAMFFISKGFDFYKKNRGLDYNKRNIITLYKHLT